jgi:HD-GYP domain-containing protein (c-di-GMP phosphodiesterase class II)
MTARQSALAPKRVPVAELRPGMYLHEIGVSWIEHPFWRSSFVIRNDDELRRIADCGVTEVWIDPSRGLDFSPEPAPPAPDSDIARDRVTAEPAATPGDEIAHAARTCSRARTAVRAMFQEVRMGKALSIDNAMSLVDEISGSVLRNPVALISLARLKQNDDYTYMHSIAVCALMVAVGRQLGLDETQTREAGLAGLFHDIGKATIDPAILRKPGRLTDEEYADIMTHPMAGWNILGEASGLGDAVLDVCRHHHERLDGSGYPDRLSGDEISLFARMGAVCDVYDAVTSERPYKQGWNPAEAMRRMAVWSKSGFDERVFHALVKTLGIYPIGSLVRMHSGRLGLVVGQSEESLLVPKVKVFFSTRSNAMIAPEVIDTALPNCRDKISGCEDPKAWNPGELAALWCGYVGA